VALWGEMPTVGQLLDTPAIQAPDKTVRNAILTRNAHALSGFPPLC